MDSALSQPAPVLTQRDIWVIFAGVLLAIFLSSLEQTIVATALPQIARDLGGERGLAWIATAYLLTGTAVTPLYGKASDIWGRRPLMLIALGLFIVGSALCALAPTLLTLALARGLQGLGGGGLMSLGQIVVGDMVTPKERGRYHKWIVMTFGVSALLGPYLGGYLSEHAHWTVIFWINVPLGLVTVAITLGVFRRLPQNHHPHTLDIVGAALVAGAATLLVLALNGGGRTLSETLALYAGSAALWVLFAFNLLRASEPLLPLRVLANPVVRTATLALMLSFGVQSGLTVYVPLYLQQVMHLSPTDAGAALIPLTMGILIGGAAGGQFASRAVNYKRLPMVGLAIAVLAATAIAIWAGRLGVPAFIALLFVVTTGVGTLGPVSTVMVLNVSDRRDIGVTTATTNFFRQLGASMAVGVFGALVLGEGLRAYDPALLFRGMFALSAVVFAVSLVVFATVPQVPLRTTHKKD